MKETLLYAVALLILIGIAYALMAYTPSRDVPIDTSSQVIEPKREVSSGETDTYKYEVQYPVFGIAAVDTKIQSIVDSAVNAFKEYPANPPDSAVPQNEMTGSYDSIYVGPEIVSVQLSISEYTGGAHGNTVKIGVNVNTKTGREITLDDALVLIGMSLQEVAAASSLELKTKLSDAFFAEGAQAKAENYGTFLIDDDSVTFVFNAYQVGPYAAGPQKVSFKRN